MDEQQLNLGFDASYSPAPAAVPELRAEIAAAWGLPLGERVEIDLQRDDLPTLTGTLELASAPEFPWNPRQPLQLRLAGCTFSTRDIARWSRV